MSEISISSPDPESILEHFELIDDIPLELRAELDRRTISFRELIELESGSVISLARPAGENIDLYAGEVLIGSGEILVLDGIMTLRLADLLGGPAAGELNGQSAGKAKDAVPPVTAESE
jgi:flagellar motor switch/type III secretory pathway protein FliN